MVVMAAEPTVPAVPRRIPKRSLGASVSSVIAIPVLSGITVAVSRSPKRSEGESAAPRGWAHSLQ